MSNKFSLVFTQSFRKDFRKIPIAIREKAIEKLKIMQFDPFDSQVKKLKNARIGNYRKRIGDYRIIFDVNYKDREIWFYQIKHRKDIYKNL